MLNRDTIYKAFDLEELNLLPNDWIDQIHSVANEFGVYTHLDGKHPSSREPEDTEGADVYVVPGDVIQKQLPWLYELYISDFVTFASQVAGQTMVPSDEVQSAINLNILRGMGSRYEWHVDTNPLTGLIFATSHNPGEGGDLVFKVEEERLVHVHPKAGTLLFFDAREIDHTVLPLKANAVRISIPMNYYSFSEGEQRSSGLDDYLYTSPGS